MTGKNRENYNKNYIDYVHSFEPPTKHFKNCLHAFGVGGLICTLGQFFRVILENVFQLSGDELAVVSPPHAAAESNNPQTRIKPMNFLIIFS